MRVKGETREEKCEEAMGARGEARESRRERRASSIDRRSRYTYKTWTDAYSLAASV